MSVFIKSENGNTSVGSLGHAGEEAESCNWSSSVLLDAIVDRTVKHKLLWVPVGFLILERNGTRKKLTPTVAPTRIAKNRLHYLHVFAKATLTVDHVKGYLI